MTRESASETAYKKQLAALQQEKEALEQGLVKLRKEKFALAEKLHQQEHSMELNHSGCFIWNLAGEELSLYFPINKVLGREVDESALRYPRLLELLHVADRFAVRRMLWELSLGVRERQQLKVYLKAAAGDVPLIISASAQRDENGKPLSVSGSLTALQPETARNLPAFYLNPAPFGLPIFRVDRQSGEPLFSNPAAKVLWQEQLGEQEIQHIGELIGSDQWQQLHQQLEQGSMDHPLAVSLGEGRELQLFAGNPDLPSVLDIILLDVSELQQTIKELQQVNFQLDNFVYHASHDLRAPLRTVLGLLDILRSESRKEERERCVNLIEGSIKRLDSLVIDLLSISRNKRGRNPLVKINFMVEVNLAVSNFYQLGNTRNLEIRTKISQPHPFISDLTRIRIVLNNIISNALKYRRYGADPSFVDIRIWVDAEAAYITVEDNGEGIAEEQLPHIFDMFFRASELSEGSGLGLYIVKDVLQKLEGSIEVSSVQQQGTTFSIRIPNQKP